MKKTSQKTTEPLDALLTDMPIAPSRDFADHVLAAHQLESLFREMPIEASPDFAERTVAAADVSRRKSEITFPQRLAAVAASFAVATVAVFIAKNEITENHALSLSSRIEQTLLNDPELSELAASEDNSPSFDEWLAASEILSAIDPNVLEIFACND